MGRVAAWLIAGGALVGVGCDLQIGPADPETHYEFTNRCGEEVVVVLIEDGSAVDVQTGQRSEFFRLVRRPQDSTIRVARPDRSGAVQFTVDKAAFVLDGPRCPTP